MILDVLLGLPIAILVELVALLPAADAAASPFDVSGVGELIGLAYLFNEGFPVAETLSLLGGYLAASLVLDGFVLVRAGARWLPSWITGGG